LSYLAREKCGLNLSSIFIGVLLMRHKEWAPMVLNAPGIPKWFKVDLLEAAVRKSTYTSNGTVYASYADAGYSFARYVGKFVEDTDLEKLETIQDDEEKIIAWLKNHVDQFFKLVPTKRRLKFVEGFMKYFEENGVTL
jgi:hypothetical protein